MDATRTLTAFQGTRLPIRTIYYAMLLMCDIPGNTPARFLQRQLGITYISARALANKIRIHMAALETPRVIGGPEHTVWIDETAIRLQGESQLTSIFGMADSRNLFLSVVPDRKASTLLPLVERGVAPGSVIVTDAFSAYHRLERLGWEHYRLNHSRGVWTDPQGRTTARIELVWRWLKRQIAGSTGQMGHDQLWKHIKQFLYRYHARDNPAEAYWRLISTYPPFERYQEEILRREVDCRWNVSSSAGAEAPSFGSESFGHAPAQLLPVRSGQDCSPAFSAAGIDDKETETGMSQIADLEAFCPVFQVLDQDPSRRTILQEIFHRCDLTIEVLADAGQLASFPECCSLVLLHDALDETTDHLVGACLAKGHGVVLYRHDHRLPRVVDLLGRGAVGYLRWPFDSDDLRGTIRAAATYGHARTQFHALRARATSLIKRLSPREKQVLGMVCAGRTSKDIADSLGLSKRTIECHRANIAAKLKVSPAWAMRLGIYAGLDGCEPWPSNSASELAAPPDHGAAGIGRRADDIEA